MPEILPLLLRTGIFVLIKLIKIAINDSLHQLILTSAIYDSK